MGSGSCRPRALTLRVSVLFPHGLASLMLGFLDSGTGDIWGWITLCVVGGGGTVWNDIPGLHQPHASRPSPSRMGQPKMSPDICRWPLKGGRITRGSEVLGFGPLSWESSREVSSSR